MKIKQNTIWALIGLLWTAIIVLFALHDYRSNRIAITELATTEARANYNKDLVYRRWAAIHGCVYVPVSEQTPPNPFLEHLPERDIETPSGRKLTLVNPAYMTRQVYELGAEQYGVRGHITSLKPLRPENKPDSWETEALLSFENGETFAKTITELDNQKHLRMMFPMQTEESCLKCHSGQGYRLGDIRGGISVTVNLEPYLSINQAAMPKRIAYQAGLWLLGILGLVISQAKSNKLLLNSEAALKDRDKTITLLLNSTLEGVCGLDANGLCTFCNKSALDMLGYEEADLIGQSLHKLIAHTRMDGSSVPKEECVSSKVIASNHPIHVDDVVLWRSDGSWFNAEYRAIPIIQDGQAVGAVATFLDTTEKKKLLEQRLRSSQLASIGELAAGMAHEINNPITGVINYAQILLNKHPEESDERDLLSRIIKEGDRVATIVQNLLCFAYKDRDEMAHIRAEDIIDELLYMIQQQLNRDGIFFDVDIADDLPNIYGNAQKLGQVILNLVSNARYALNEKFPETHPDKILRISICQEEIEDERRLQLTVWDQGCGIPKEHLEKIFNPFFTTKAAGTGTGLGLSVSHDILVEHGATVYVDSEVDQFTKVVIEFPSINLVTSHQPVHNSKTG